MARNESVNRVSAFTRVCFPIALLISTACAVMGADSKVKPVLTFSLTATNQNFVVRPESDFRLEVFGNPTDWSVAVSRGNLRGWLLYPKLDWHGLHESDLSPWAHAHAYYPDERVIRVRGYQRWVRIRIIEATVSGEKESLRFTGGRCEIYWQDSGKGTHENLR